MILIDNNQIIIAAIFQCSNLNLSEDESMLRHIVLNTYRMYRTQFKEKYGELVICHDSANCWRKDILKEYKANRRAKQASDKIDWDRIFDQLTVIRDEIREVFPYKNVQVDRTEADDVIYTLAVNHCAFTPVLIISNDKDFQQLQIHDNIKQYSPMKKTFLTCESPKNFLLEHILKGDSSDGIPNILSDDDVFVSEDKRQKRLTKKVKDQIYEDLSSTGKVSEDLQRNWERNKKLIDLSEIPKNIQNDIMEAFKQPAKGKRSNILDYMIKYNLKLLTEHIQEF